MVLVLTILVVSIIPGNLDTHLLFTTKFYNFLSLFQKVLVKVCDVIVAKMGANSKIVIRMMDIKHASQNMKMVPIIFSLSSNNFYPNVFSDQRVARGCSTKRPMLYVECEAHKSKNVLEEFCYCSYDLCNTDHGNTIHLNMGLLVLIVILVINQTN